MNKLKAPSARISQEFTAIRHGSKLALQTSSTYKLKGKTRTGKANPEINSGAEDPASISELDSFFKDDFAVLCERNGFSFIPNIIPRPQAPLVEKARVKQKEARVLAGRPALRVGESNALLTSKVSGLIPVSAESRLDAGRLKGRQAWTERAVLKSELSISSADGRAAGAADSPKSKSRQVQDENLVPALSPHFGAELDRFRRPRTLSMAPGAEKGILPAAAVAKVAVAPAAPVLDQGGGGGGGGAASSSSSPEGRLDSIGGKGKRKEEELSSSSSLPRKGSTDDHRMDSGTFTAYKPKDSVRSGIIPEDEARVSTLKRQTPELTFNTFSTTTNLMEYFHPCIQVEQEKGEKGTVVTEVYIRGWKAEAAMMEVLLQSCSRLYQMRTLSLWRAALDAGALLAMADHLPFCRKLHTLVLDGNCLRGKPVSSLVGSASVLQTLSLRFCELSDYEVLGIAARLGHSLLANSCLLHLHLSNNCITDVGVAALAKALKVNFMLLTLNLASNQVGDEGVAELCAVLSYFPLTHEQIVRRRQLLSEELDKENRSPRLEPSRSNSPHHLTSPREDRTRKQEPKDLKEVKDPKESKDRLKSTSSSAVPPALKGRKPSTTCLSKKHPESLSHDTRAPEGPYSKLKVLAEARQRAMKKLKAGDVPNTTKRVAAPETSSKIPLLATGKLRNGELWVRGNRTLISLNLSRNRIGKKGMKALRVMLEAQTESRISTAGTPVGLRRLVIHGNAVDEKDEDVRIINTVMRCRDPLNRLPRINLCKSYVTPCSIPRPF